VRQVMTTWPVASNVWRSCNGSIARRADTAGVKAGPGP
jgi:hypothetical protein